MNWIYFIFLTSQCAFHIRLLEEKDAEVLTHLKMQWSVLNNLSAQISEPAQPCSRPQDVNCVMEINETTSISNAA